MKIPPSLPIECELPVATPPAIPQWSENYCLQAYDPTSGFGFWFHAGLPVYDNGLWHDKVMVYLPGGESLLLAKGFSPRSGAETQGPRGSMLHGDYDETTGEWVWRFHGAASRVNRSVLTQGLKRDSAVEPLRFELRFAGLAPVWDLTGQIGKQVWSVSGAHWEQPCHVTGWVEVAGERHDIAGTGIRDHSRGARNFTNMGSHFWLHGQFPSGRAFGLIHVESADKQSQTLSHAYTVSEGKLVDAQIVSLPSERTFLQGLEVRFRDAHGEHRVTGELIHDAALTLRYPNEVLFGHDRSQPAHFLREGQIRWSWDGEIGYGLGERTSRLNPDGSE